MKLFLQKTCSYITPILIEKCLSEYSNNVEVYLHYGEYMLCSPDAMYSFGIKYAPFVKAFQFLNRQNKLLNIKNFLMLGGGFCSALHILNKKYNVRPSTIVVEKDKEIVRLANKYIPANIKNNISIINADAFTYIQTNIVKYNVIAIDIFIDMQMPEAILQNNFLETCYNNLSTNGILIINTYFINTQKSTLFDETFKNIFSNYKIISHQKNNIYIGFV